MWTGCHRTGCRRADAGRRRCPVRHPALQGVRTAHSIMSAQERQPVATRRTGSSGRCDPAGATRTRRSGDDWSWPMQLATVPQRHGRAVGPWATPGFRRSSAPGEDAQRGRSRRPRNPIERTVGSHPDKPPDDHDHPVRCMEPLAGGIGAVRGTVGIGGPFLPPAHLAHPVRRRPASSRARPVPAIELPMLAPESQSPDDPAGTYGLLTNTVPMGYEPEATSIECPAIGPK